MSGLFSTLGSLHEETWKQGRFSGSFNDPTGKCQASLSSQMQMPQPWLGSSRALPYQYDRPYTETLKGQVALPK